MRSADVRPPFVLYATCQVENHRESITRVSDCMNGYLAAARSGLSLSILGAVKDGNLVGRYGELAKKTIKPDHVVLFIPRR